MEFINPIFEFSRAMRRLGLDDAEYALLIAINIFSADRPNVQEPSRVEALQQPYVEALLSYTRIKRPQVPEPSPSWGQPGAGVLLLSEPDSVQPPTPAPWQHSGLTDVLSVEPVFRHLALQKCRVPMLWPAAPPTGSPGSPQRGLTSASQGRARTTPTSLLSPAGPAALPSHADEAREPAHAELCALGAGLCPAAPGQEAATSAV